MPAPGVEEWIVEPVLARCLIEEQFPELSPARVEPLGSGWDNVAFRVNDCFVFRFPRRAVAAPALEVEASLLPWLSTKLPLEIPMPRFHGRALREFPWPFLGARLMAGRTACAVGLSGPERSRCAVPLARFLAGLHAVSPEECLLCSVPGDTWGRLDLERRNARAHETLDRLARREALSDTRALREILDRAPEHYEARTDVLVHGDLYARHLMIDDKIRLTGVIDWGDLHLGDPAVDLAVAHSFLPPDARTTFRDIYGPIDQRTWEIARLRALWHALTVLESCPQRGDADLERETRIALGHLAIA